MFVQLILCLVSVPREKIDRVKLLSTRNSVNDLHCLPNVFLIRGDVNDENDVQLWLSKEMIVDHWFESLVTRVVVLVSNSIDWCSVSLLAMFRVLANDSMIYVWSDKQQHVIRAIMQPLNYLLVPLRVSTVQLVRVPCDCVKAVQMICNARLDPLMVVLVVSDCRMKTDVEYHQC